MNKFRSLFVKKDKTIRFVIAVLLGLYVFTFMSFGSMGKLHFIVYPVLVLLATIVFLYLFFTKKIAKNISLLLPIIFAFSAIISTLIGSRSFSKLKTILLLIISFYILFLAFWSVDNVKLIIVVLAVSSFSFSLFFFAVYFKEIITLRWSRLGTFFGNENDVGINLYFSMLMTILLYFTYKKIYILPFSFLCMMASFSTGSKKAVILSLITVIIFIFFLFRKKPILLTVCLFLFVIIVAVLFNLPALSSIRNRIVQAINIFSNDYTDGSTQNRLLFFENSIYLGTKNFIFGLGANGFTIVSGFNKYSHNNFGEVLCNFGFLGLIAFYSPIAIFVSNLKKNHGPDLMYVISFLLFCAVSAFSLVVLDSKLYYVMLALAYSIVIKNRIKYDIANRNKYVLLEI